MLKRTTIVLLLTVTALMPLLQWSPATALTPEVVAEQWIVVDGPTGAVIGAEDATTRRPMASLTKVMTAVVALERGNLDMPVTITQGDKVPESSAGIFVGTTPTLRTLLHGLLLASGNDAAMAIARAVGGSASFENDGARAQFVAWMNEKAAELGMDDTHFTNPHGLDEEGHFSTPADLVTLTRYALTVPDFREIFGAEEFSDEGYSFVQGNQLTFLRDDVTGGKTGWTDDCGRCLIEVIWIDGRDVIIVLMGSDLNWYNDAIALADFSAAMPRPADTPERAAQHFDGLWERTDSLVAAGVEERSWLWGAPLTELTQLASTDSTTGARYERLYEKGSMEINHPYSQMNSGWYITPGRLAATLIEEGATLPVAGDIRPTGPHYADLAEISWQPQDAGTPIDSWLSSGGQLVARDAMAAYGVVAGEPSDATGLATASVFEDYLWQSAAVVENGEIVDGLLFDPPVFAIGHPITEAFWATVPENGEYVDVLVQCFERRCLTYTPSHDPAWQVEMSNIGIHTQLWQARPADVTATGQNSAIPRDRLVLKLS